MNGHASGSEVSPRLMPLLAFTGCYMIALSVVALRTGNRALPMYLILLGIVIALLFAVHRRRGLPGALLWCFSVWGLVHMAGGLAPIPPSWPREGGGLVLYNWWLVPSLLKFDHVVHAFGFGITTWLCWHLLATVVAANLGRRPQPSAALLMVCAAGGMGFGALNEMIEFIATLALPESNIGDYANAGWDLVANFVGAIVAVIWIRRAEMRSRDIKV